MKNLREGEVMKKCLIVLVLCLGGLLAGCNLVDTPEERNNRIAQSWDLQGRMMVADFDAYLLLDRNSYLTPWFTKVGY